MSTTLSSRAYGDDPGDLTRIGPDLCPSPLKLVWFANAARRLVPYEFWFEFHRVPGWQELNSTDHTAIIDSMEAHDAEAAGSHMQNHFLATSKLLLEWLDSISFWDPERADPATAPPKNSRSTSLA